MKAKKKKRRINTSKLMIVLSLLFMIIIGIYVFLNSNVFKIKDIEIQGNSRVSNEIIKIDLEVKNDKNIFMYNTRKMEDKIKENSYIEQANIKKVLPDKLLIKIKEKEISGLLEYKGNYSYIDKDGNLIAKAQKIEEDENSVIVETVYTVENNSTLKFKNEEIKKGLLYLLECIKNDNLHKKISNIDFTKNDVINMYTKDGIEIILKNDKNLKYNISRISTILVDLQGKNAKGGVVDLTYGDNAIYTP